MVSSKKCFKCGEVKELTEFYPHKRMKDGTLNKCKKCTKNDVLEHREKNIERIRSYDRARAKIPERARKAAEISTKWRNEDSRRMKCHSAVSRALRNGTLIHKCCEWPGCDRQDSYAHHESYDKPLDVIFYCQPHHKARHAQMRELCIEP